MLESWIKHGNFRRAQMPCEILKSHAAEIVFTQLPLMVTAKKDAWVRSQVIHERGIQNLAMQGVFEMERQIK